jgi:hypothetical protein
LLRFLRREEKPLKEYRLTKFGLTGLCPANSRPKPFAGRFPTRWLAILYLNGKVLFVYQGKPNSLVAAKIQDLVRRGPQESVFYLRELDRNGAIAEVIVYPPRRVMSLWGFGVENWRPDLYRFYYPITWHRGTLFSAAPLYPKRVLLSEHKAINTYAETETTPPEHIQDYYRGEYRTMALGLLK